MTTENDLPTSSYVALAGFLWAVFIVTPIWFTILYVILSSINASSWVWGLYFAYIPVSFTGNVLITSYKILLSKEKSSNENSAK